MQEKTQNTVKPVGQLRSDARVSYLIKRSLSADIIAGAVSILLAAAVWFFVG